MIIKKVETKDETQHKVGKGPNLSITSFDQLSVLSPNLQIYSVMKSNFVLLKET
jgi:hypothetical protein